MNTFKLETSVWGYEVYPRWIRKEISLAEVVTFAFEEGVNDQEDPGEEMLLNHVMGVVGGYIVTYDAVEDIIDVWRQLN